MNRTLLTALLCGLAMFVTWKWGAGLLGGRLTVVVKPGDMMPVTTVLLVATGLAWIAFATCSAIRDVVDMVTEARARRRKRRDDAARLARQDAALGLYLRIGGGPAARPEDLAA